MPRSLIAISGLCIFLLSIDVSFADESPAVLSPQNNLRPLSSLSPQEQAAYKQHEQLPFAQEYIDGLNGVFFHARYKNETAKRLDARPLLGQSTILLDGKQYPYDGPKPTWLAIQAGEDSSFTISPDNYVPKVKRGVLTDSLHRWQWVSGIPAGTHTLWLEFGGRLYGPVQYSQPGTSAWTVPHE